MPEQKIILGNNPQSSTVSGAKSRLPDEYLLSGWFPINTELVKNIIARLEAGEFADRRKNLIEFLKKDLALISYLMRKIPAGDELCGDPLKLLEIVPLEQILRYVKESVLELSTHSLAGTLKPQSLRLKQSLISCSAAELLANKRGVDPNLAFSVSLLRQVGLSLVAWNYPRIYTKAVSQISTSEDDLDTILFKNLGFSPKQMGIALTIGSPSADLKIALGLDQPSQESIGKILWEISDLSESFAQANDPEHYPNVTRKWNLIEGKIIEILGPHGLTLLKEKLKAASMSYSVIPNFFSENDLSKERNIEIANQKRSENLLTQNSSAMKLSSDLQIYLKKVYSLVRTNEVSPEAIQALIIDCIPQFGFTNGCVFIQDNNTHSLVPKLRIGERPLDEYKKMVTVGSISEDNPILESLQSTIPVKRDGIILFGERVSLVSGMIGNPDKSGVLYLEMSQDLSNLGGFEPVLRFKAIRHCLNQCLNIKAINYL